MDSIVEVLVLIASFVIGVLIQRNNAAIEKQNDILEGIKEQYFLAMEKHRDLLNDIKAEYLVAGERQRDALREVEQKFDSDIDDLTTTSLKIIQSLQRSELKIQEAQKEFSEVGKSFFRHLKAYLKDG